MELEDHDIQKPVATIPPYSALKFVVELLEVL